jgi:hypothetical protein
MMSALIKRSIPIFTSVLALIWIYLGSNAYGFWEDKSGPAGGFFPVIIGCILLLVSVINIISAGSKTPEFSKDSFLLLGAAVTIFASSLVIGMIPALLAFMLIWLRAYEKQVWKTTLVTTGVMGAIVIGVFVLWLQVSFPKGILYEFIVYGLLG